MTLTISQFWLDRIAGIPLGPAGAGKQAEFDRAELNELSMQDWMRIGRSEQLQLLRAAVAEAA
jgi:hypothetical protein